MSYPSFFKWLWLFGKITIGGYISICIILRFAQNRLIFVPSQQIETTPKDFKIAYEEVWIPVGKEDKIHGWWIPSSSPNAKNILYLHGNGLNIGANAHHATRLQSYGFSVLLIDYRGYGLSKGSFPNEKRVYEDARIAWEYLLKQRSLKAKNIFIYGHSLGGAIAIDLATHHPHAAGLIVESSFTSMRDAIDYRGGIYKFFPVDLLLTQKFTSINKIAHLKMPLLLIHGTMDSTIPHYMSERLFTKATVPKKILLVPFAGHNNVATVAPQEYSKTVFEFRQLVEKKQRSIEIKQSI
jgi:hypothetical protein